MTIDLKRRADRIPALSMNAGWVGKMRRLTFEASATQAMRVLNTYSELPGSLARK